MKSHPDSPFSPFPVRLFPMRTLTAILCLNLAVLLGSMGVSWSANYQKGFAAAQSGDYATALREWAPLAKQGNALAQYNLGLMYDKGRGVAQDDRSAMKWYGLAAKQGNTEAQKRYGELVLQDFVYGSDIQKIKNLGKSVEISCEDDIKCAFNQIWAYLDVTKNGRLSLAEIARFQRNVVKLAAVEAGDNIPEVEEIIGINLASIIFLPITASSMLNSFDYNDDGSLSKDEVLGDTEFSRMVGIDVETLSTGLDFQSLGEKLLSTLNQIPLFK